MATLDPSEIMFTPFEPKTKNRFIMYIEGIPAYLIKTANFGDLDYASSDPAEIQLTLKYDYAILQF